MVIANRRTTVPVARRVQSLAVLAAATLALSSCGSDPEATSSNAGDQSPAPAASSTPPTTSSAVEPRESASATPEAVLVPDRLNFSATTVAGEPFEGASVAGKPTVFWFWAPWCATCRAQISGVGELAAQFGEDVAVVGVGAPGEAEAIEEFAGTVSSDVTLLSDPDGAVWRHFGVTAQSTYLVLDAAGEPQASGFLDGDDLVSTVSALVTG